LMHVKGQQVQPALVWATKGTFEPYQHGGMEA
jgi:hypothetical protein